MPDPDLPKDLESVARPEPRTAATKAQIKLSLMNARTSSRIGIALIAIPALFIGGVVLHYGLRLPVPGFVEMENALSSIEHGGFGRILSPLILVGIPLVVLITNLLAVTHVEMRGREREMHVTVRLRPVNLALAVLSFFIMAIVFAHSVAD